MLVRFIFQRLKTILQTLENNFWKKMYLKSKIVWMYQEVIKSHQSHQGHPSKASKVCLKYNVFHIYRQYSTPWRFSVGIWKYKPSYKSNDLLQFECSHWWKTYFSKKKSFIRFALQSECSNFNQWEHLNLNRSCDLYYPAYTYKFQLKTPHV